MKAAIGAAIAILAVVAPATGATAGAVRASSSACTATSGVTVVVDFTHFSGGQVERGCASGTPANGLDALHAAGFTTAGTAQYGDAFLCRIDGLPTPQHESCAATPPANAYWAFWHARPTEASWTYSNVGVLDYKPAAGSIEAFAFGTHATPSIPPSDALPSPPPTTRPPSTTTPPATSPAPTTSPVSPAAVPPASAGTTAPPTSTSGAASASTSTTGASRTTAHKRAHTSTSTTRGPTTTRPAPRVIDRAAAGPHGHSGSGSPLGAIAAILVVGCLAAGAFVFARTRRPRAA